MAQAVQFGNPPAAPSSPLEKAQAAKHEIFLSLRALSRFTPARCPAEAPATMQAREQRTFFRTCRGIQSLFHVRGIADFSRHGLGDALLVRRV